jgi:hypothetical protein
MIERDGSHHAYVFACTLKAIKMVERFGDGCLGRVYVAQNEKNRPNQTINLAKRTLAAMSLAS